MHFFWPNLRCKVIEKMVKSRYLVEFPAQKRNQNDSKTGRFKKNSSAFWDGAQGLEWHLLHLQIFYAFLPANFGEKVPSQICR